MDHETLALQQKLEFQAFLCDLLTLCSSPLSMAAFLSEFLSRTLTVMEAEGGSIWVPNRRGLEPAFQMGVAKELISQAPTDSTSNGSIPSQVFQEKKPYVATLDGRSSNRSSQAGFFAIYVPIEVGDEALGVLQVIKPKREDQVVYAEEVHLLRGLVSFVSLYVNNLRLPKILNRMEELTRLFEINREIFSSLDPLKIAYSLANLIPSLVPCGRCVVALPHKGKKLKVKAISGQDLIEGKSVVIKRLARLLRQASLHPDPVHLSPSEEGPFEENPALREAMEAYFKVNPFKSLYVLPLFDEGKAFGAVALESAEVNPLTQNDQAMAQLLARQAAVAFRNAQLHHRVPFRYPYEKLLSLKEKLLDIPRVKLILWGALGILAISLPFIVQVDTRVEGSCDLLPKERYLARPKIDGVLKELRVREGQEVQKGQLVALLDDREQQEKLRGARARREAIQAEMVKQFGLDQRAEYEIQRLKLQEVETEIQLLTSEIEKTRILAEGPGIVLTPQPRLSEKIGKAVSRGEELLELADPHRLFLEVAVPEEDIAWVQRGQSLSFLLNSLPEKKLEAQVADIRQKAEAREKGNFFIVEGRLSQRLDYFRPGMKGEAKIYCEKNSLAYVLCRRLINFFRVKVLF